VAPFCQLLFSDQADDFKEWNDWNRRGLILGRDNSRLECMCISLLSVSLELLRYWGGWKISLAWTALCASVLGSVHVCGDHECCLCILWPRPWSLDLWLRWSPPTAVLFPPLACCSASFGCALAQSAVALLFSVQWDALVVSRECSRWLRPCFTVVFVLDLSYL
jgi:hypothetical protein